MHGDILPAIPIVTPNYAVTAAKWQHLPAITMLFPHLPAITMLWRHLPAITAYGIIWVLDSTDRLRITIAKCEIETITCHENLKSAVYLY